jgi:hypothetical protein
MSKKQPVIEYRFPPELVAAMRVAFLKACEAPQVTGAAQSPRRRGPADHGKGWACFGFGPGNQSADLEARRPGTGSPARPQHPCKRRMISNNRATTVTNLFDAAPRS